MATLKEYGFWIALLLAASSPQAFASGPIEVVQSVPIETTLSVPGIRQTQQVWLEMINAAQSSIDLEEFYIYSQPGESLEPVLDAIRAAAARGVQVRFLIDSTFYSTYPTDADQLSQVPGVQVKTIDFSSQGGVQHSKYFVVDQSQVFLGSANFDWLALTHIHEVGLRIPDAQIASGLESVFSKDWDAGTSISGTDFVSFSAQSCGLRVPGGQDVPLLIASPPSDNPSGVPDSLSAITQMIAQASGSLKIQMYEYTTQVYQSSAHWTVLDTAIRNAASRGVHVQLLVDKTALKTGKKDLQALASLPGIEVRVVTIPQWSGGPIPYARLIHSKYFIVDNASVWVGSENWSEDYFTNSRNVGVTLNSPDVASELDQIFSQVWNSAYTSQP